jgi:hypothetical protein
MFVGFKLWGKTYTSIGVNSSAAIRYNKVSSGTTAKDMTESAYWVRGKDDMDHDPSNVGNKYDHEVEQAVSDDKSDQRHLGPIRPGTSI